MNNLQRGFSLITAIFLLVVLAGLGAAMVTFSIAQNQSQAMDVLGSRAYQAADAGIEWAAYNIAVASNVAKAPALVFAPGTATALGGDLAQFSVTVGYDATLWNDAVMVGAASAVLYTHTITSTATFGTPGTANYVERVVQAKM